VANQIRSLAEVENIDFIMYDPAVPIGILGPKIGISYGVILHGAEVTIPGRVPIARSLIANVLQHAKLVVTAGDYSTKEAIRAAKQNLPVCVIPPGVDIDRFKPLDEQARSTIRERFNFKDDDEVILTLSRLVPRKGMDVLISATSELVKTRPRAHLLIAGTGRDLRRLKALAQSTNAPVTFLGFVSDDEVAELYGMADVFGMICRVRWGGLEQEGFGIVFLEAAACGVPQIAGRSGGADEAVLEGETGFVVDNPTDSNAVKQALEKLLTDSETRQEMGRNSRARAEKEFSYDYLAIKYWEALLLQQQ